MIKIGDTISSRYNVLSHLGTGGMAVVFECKDLYTSKIVALKILKEELLDNKSAISDFEKEVRASVTMSHENIMEIFDEGKFENRPYLVMEYLNSQTLLDKIEYYTKFSINEACLIMIQLLKAIGYTHKHGIIHRDIKPQNIFYLSNGSIKLGDFGIAKKEGDNEIDGEILGSIHYLAPEVLTHKKFSVLSDIYAAGITFFQLITGRLPFDGSTKEVAEKQVKSVFPIPSSIISDIPNDIDLIILKAVSKNPKARYKNADEFINEIEDYLSGKKIKRSFFDRFF